MVNTDDKILFTLKVINSLTFILRLEMFLYLRVRPLAPWNFVFEAMRTSAHTF